MPYVRTHIAMEMIRRQHKQNQWNMRQKVGYNYTHSLLFFYIFINRSLIRKNQRLVLTPTNQI